MTSAISDLCNFFVVFQDLHKLLWQHAACCFVVIFLVFLGTQSCWCISFRLSVLKRKILLCFLRSECSFPPFPFLPSGKCTLFSYFPHSFIAAQNAPKYMLIQMFPMLNCWKYLPKVWLFYNCWAWSLQLASAISGFLEFLSSFCPLPASVL